MTRGLSPRSPGQVVYLVLHQGDQRRQHQRGGRTQHGRELIAQRLSGAGWHERQCVRPSTAAARSLPDPGGTESKPEVAVEGGWSRSVRADLGQIAELCNRALHGPGTHFFDAHAHGLAEQIFLAARHKHQTVLASSPPPLRAILAFRLQRSRPILGDLALERLVLAIEIRCCTASSRCNRSFLTSSAHRLPNVRRACRDAASTPRTYTVEKRTSSMSESVSANCSSVSPGKPTMMSVERASVGAARADAADQIEIVFAGVSRGAC